MHPCSPVSGFKSFSLTSVELQMLTNSCVKLQTVHSIPLTTNKEGGPPCRGHRPSHDGAVLGAVCVPFGPVGPFQGWRDGLGVVSPRLLAA